MRFKLTAPWACGPNFIEAGTEFEGPVPKYQGQPVPLPMPLCAMALDDEAYAHLVHAYVTDPHDLNRILRGPGVKPITAAELPMWFHTHPKPKSVSPTQSQSQRTERTNE